MKTKILPLLLAGLLLGGCRAAALAPTATPEPTSAPLPSALPSVTPPLPAPTASLPSRPPGTPLSADIAGPAMDGCTLQALLPSPDATESSLFPAAGEGDWIDGPDGALTTIVEYGDFQ